jgi:hypothetical protein
MKKHYMGGLNVKGRKITPKEKLFCVYYIESRNGREAAARAVYLICPVRAAE